MIVSQLQEFCTIVTANYFPKAAVLYKSLREYNYDVILRVLVADDEQVIVNANLYSGIKLLTLKDLSANPILDKLYRKYAHIDSDQFRWALKPILLRHLIEEGSNKVIYVDCDIFFSNNYNFLFEELDSSDILLTPHWQTIDPLFHQAAFLSNFTNGIFNAGFIGVNKNSLPALTWWAKACHFKMGGLYDIGIQDDQKYLDIFPVYFEKTKILHHKGCNVGIWNKDLCKRTLVNGKVLINEIFPVVFVHFTNLFMKDIMKGNDNLLIPFLEKYKKMFEEEGSALSSFMKDITYYLDPHILKIIKWRLKVRTRTKRFFYKLAESI